MRKCLKSPKNRQKQPIKEQVMEKITSFIEKIPTWAICAIVNADYSGLEDEDIEILEKWLDTCGYDHICCPNEDAEPYFTPCPAFGLACEVYDVECLIFT